jgi:alkylation response protein AidB-like acyl-CoA dehydrogenase
MDLRLGSNQLALADSVAGVLRRSYDFEARRALLAAPIGGDGAWRLLSQELGLTGLRVSTEDGGQGATPLDAMVVMEALGRHLLLDPFAERCIIVPAILRGVEKKRDLLAAIARDEIRVVPAFADAGFDGDAAFVSPAGDGFQIDGQIRFVVGGPTADHFVITARGVEGLSLFLVPEAATGLSRSDYRMVDGREASDLHFEGVKVAADALIAAGDRSGPLLARARDEGMAALCAEAVGVMREMIRITIDYTSQRTQFGAAIASFQVVQHRLVDMAMAVEKADALTLRATLMLDADDAVRAPAAAAAKVMVSEAVRMVGQSAVQLHGAVGTVEDTPISHYFRRATVIDGQFGTGPHNLERYAAAFARAAFSLV